MITKAQLKEERGWTDALIKRFLPSPDETRQNPRYRKAAPMCLYRICRVEEIEASQEFMEPFANAKERKASSQKGVERKRKATLEWAGSLPPPTLVPRTREELLAQAVQHYNSLWSARGNCEKYASLHDSPEFLERITVNFVRHELTEYESRLRGSYRRVGKAKAIQCIRELILDAIAAAYPSLSDECHRQKCSSRYDLLW